MDRLDMESKKIVSSNIEKIKELFPNVITESDGKAAIDFDLLKQELSKDLIDDKKEKYQLTWPGKKQAIVNANSSISKTLRPKKEKSVNFENTKNIYIEGDNLEALKLLQESYLNKIKFIYIDPPYNTGTDFIYKDNYSKDTEQELIESGQIDEAGNRLITNNQSNGKFHSEWLTMMYSRIKLARNLLSSDGIMFISIDDNESSNLKKICDEIFGEYNSIPIFYRVTKKSSNSGNNFSPCIDQVLGYAKDINKLNEFKIGLNDEIRSRYNKSDEYEEERGTYQEVGLYQAALKHGGSSYPIECPDGECVIPPNGLPWRWNQETFKKGLEDGRIVFKQTGTSPLLNYNTKSQANWNVYTKVYLKEREDSGMHPKNFSDEFQNTMASTELNKLNIPFDFAKPTELISFLMGLMDDKNLIALDFFSGSATTGAAVYKLNKEDNGSRRFILVQIPQECDVKSKAYTMGYENICDIGEDRLKKTLEYINDFNSGYRVYTIDSSNMKDVYYKPNEITQENLFDYISNVKEDRTSEDLLTQVILDLGLTLDLKIDERKLGNNNVYFVAENSLVACFDDEINIDIMDEICKCKPIKVVFKENSFKSDKDKINLEEKIKKLSPDTDVYVL